MADDKPRKKQVRNPAVPKPVYVMYKGEATIVDVVRKPEDVLAIIDADADVKYQKVDVS